MKHFLILFDDIPIDKASVKSGNNSLEVITAARCVNVGLFISGNLRRDVIISLAKGLPDDLKIISFAGDHLRRVSPDERSISFFLLKAISIVEELVIGAFETMDNGIEVRRTSLEAFLESFAPMRVYLSTPESAQNSVDDVTYENSLLIHSGKRLDLVQESTLGIQRELRYYPHPERFILDVIISSDMKKAS
jgi:tRNA pseudouridine-54 N-methylase